MIVLIAMILMVTVPFLISDREYPMQSGDTKNHIIVALRGNLDLDKGDYFGEALGIPAVKAGNALGISPEKSYLYFDLTMLALVMIALYFVFSKLVSQWTGLMAVWLTVFCSFGIANLFHSGAIFDIINMCGFLLLGFYFIIRWLASGKLLYVIGIVITLGAFSVFHPTGVYLAPILAIFTIPLIIIRKYRAKGLLLIVVLLAISGAIWLVFSGIRFAIGHPIVPPISASEFIFKYLKITIPVLLIPAAGYLLINRNYITEQAKLLILALLSAIAVLIVLGFTTISADPGRAAIDLTIILSLLTACLLGTASLKDKRIITIASIVALAGSIPLFKVWLLGSGG